MLTYDQHTEEEEGSCRKPVMLETFDPVKETHEVVMPVPVRRHAPSLEKRQRSIGERMNERMEQRKKEWDSEVAILRREFFRLKPDETKRGGIHDPLDKLEIRNRFYDAGASDDVAGNDGKDGKDRSRLFRVSFDVSHFQPSELSVRTQDHRLIINARHERKGTDKNITREFSRQVDIPPNVDPLKLRSTLSKTGILQIEAEMTTPTPSCDQTHVIHADPDTSASLITTQPRSPRVSCPPLSQGATCRPNSTSSGPDYGPSVTEQNGEKLFRISVDIGVEFQPGDLTVRTVDRKLVLHARHEEKIPGRTSSKEFNREFDLPDSVDPNLVTALMTGEGKLVLQAPVTSNELGHGHTEVTELCGSRRQPSVDISFEPRIP